MEENGPETADNAKALERSSKAEDGIGQNGSLTGEHHGEHVQEQAPEQGLEDTGASGGFGAFKLFLAPNWWKNSFRSAFIYGPKCIVPAGMFTLAGLIMLGTLDALKDKLTASQGTLQLGDLLITMLAVMGGAFIAIVLIVMSFGTWIVRLTSYCRFVLSTKPGHIMARSEVIQLQDEHLKYVRQRKPYVSILFLYVTLYLSLPCLFVVGWLLCLSLPATMPTLTLPALPPPINVLLTGLALLLSIMLSVVSFVALAVGGVSSRPPRAAANQCLALSCRLLLPLVVTVFVSLVLVTLISAPETFSQLANPRETLMKSSNVTLEALETIWQGVTSVVLFPVFAGAICEVLRGRIE